MELNSRSVLRGLFHEDINFGQVRLDQLLDKALTEDALLGPRNAVMQCDGRRITFGQLNQRANQVASRLMEKLRISEKDGNKHHIVAVCVPPNIDLITSLLAIFKSGSAYLPLDPTFPPERIAHILDDANPTLLITSKCVLESSPSFARSVENLDLLRIDELDSSETELEGEIFNISEKESLAAVLYTSGSTGIPKGVRLNHGTILHRLKWQCRTFPYSQGEVGCFKTSLTFVDSIAEIWGPLLAGKPLQIVPKDVVQDTERLISLLDDCQITRLVLVPSLLKAILAILKSNGTSKLDSPLKHLKMWICSGEVLQSQLLLDFYDIFPSGTIMCNFYGRYYYRFHRFFLSSNRFRSSS